MIRTASDVPHDRRPRWGVITIALLIVLVIAVPWWLGVLWLCGVV